jgi:hypothetical protein
MWVRTTANNLVNIAGARNVVIEPDFEYSPREALRIVAYYDGGEPMVLALVVEEGREYADGRAAAYYRAIMEGLRAHDHFCDLADQ